MAELLLELFSEEIPGAHAGPRGEDLRRLVIEGLKAQGLAVGEAKAYATPRRLALVVEGVPAKSPDLSEERKGPRVNAPEQAIAGFLKSAGLGSIGEAKVVADAKKGDFYVAKIEKPGRAAKDIVAEVVPDVVAKFPWPKSMRWGSGRTTWVRPLHSVLCLLDGKVVPFEIAGVESGNETRGHRFHGNEPFKVSGAADYAKGLGAHKVMLDAAERSGADRGGGARAGQEAQAGAGRGRGAARRERRAHRMAAGADGPLRRGVPGGAGRMPDDVDEAAPEVLLAARAEDQAARQPLPARLQPARQGRRRRDRGRQREGDRGAALRRQVLLGAGPQEAARRDGKRARRHHLPREAGHAEGAGGAHRRAGFQIAGSVDAVPEDARRAAQLAKADLVSGMVGEFPELQGLMGRYYAQAGGIKPEIARAIELHYKPKGPTDTVPRVEEGDAVAVAVALADKLDTLVGFWAIGEKPTGSGDPYQLRRAALGVIRIVLENDLRLPLVESHHTFTLSSARDIPQPGSLGERKWRGGWQNIRRGDSPARSNLLATRGRGKGWC